MTLHWRVVVSGVYPSLKPCPTPDIYFDLWFGDDEQAARDWFDEWEGEAKLYVVDSTIGDLGNTLIANK